MAWYVGIGALLPAHWQLAGTGSRPRIQLKSYARDVDLPGRGRVHVDHGVDVTGQTCLKTNLVAKRVLEMLAPGQVVEIASDNLSAVETIPFMLDGHDCEHLGTVQVGSLWKVYARRRAD